MGNQLKKKLFVISGNPVYADAVRQELKKVPGLEVEVFFSFDDCVPRMSEIPDMVILDHDAQTGKDSAYVIRNLLTIQPTLPLLIISDVMTKELALQCLVNDLVTYISRKSCQEGCIAERVYERLYGSWADLSYQQQAG